MCLLSAFCGMSRKKGFTHINSTILHHTDYCLLDLAVINYFLVHATIFVKKILKCK